MSSGRIAHAPIQVQRVSGVEKGATAPKLEDAQEYVLHPDGRTNQEINIIGSKSMFEHTEYVASHTGARNSAGQANFITIDTLGTLRTRAHSSLKSAARAPARRRGGQRRREPSLTTKTPAMRWEAQYHSTYDDSSSQSDSEGATSSSGTDTGDGLTSDSDSADHSPSDRNIISDTGD